MRIVWILASTVKSASLHCCSTWAELSRKAKYTAVPLHSPTPCRWGQNAVPCSAIQKITGILVEDCWSMLKQLLLCDTLSLLCVCVSENTCRNVSEWTGHFVQFHSVPSGKCHILVAVVLPPQSQNDSAWFCKALANGAFRPIPDSPCLVSAAPPLHHQDPSQATAWSCEPPQKHWQTGTESLESRVPTCSSTCWYLLVCKSTQT